MLPQQAIIAIANKIQIARNINKHQILSLTFKNRSWGILCTKLDEKWFIEKLKLPSSQWWNFFLSRVQNQFLTNYLACYLNSAIEIVIFSVFNGKKLMNRICFNSSYYTSAGPSKVHKNTIYFHFHAATSHHTHNTFPLAPHHCLAKTKTRIPDS